MDKRSIHDLQMMQAAPLSAKIKMTQRRIRDWVGEYGVDGVYVSFSGGKDSTVLLTLAREIYPDIKAVFVDTGLEYPEIREFVKTWDNVDWIKPKMTFREVLEKYGYPFISKEVSECVYGARKYLNQVLTSLPENESALTDRQTDSGISGTSRSIVSYVDKASMAQNSRGGWTTSTANSEGLESTEVPLRMGETHRNRQIWQAIQSCQIGGGGRARDFANLTGIRTSTPRTVDPRLWSGYRQFQNPTSDGDTSSDGQSNDGDYP